MSRRQPEFKATQVFDWAHEPADERPTDFGRSTGYSLLSGYAALQEVPAPAHRRHTHRSGGSQVSLLVGVLLVVSLGLTALVFMARYLR